MSVFIDVNAVIGMFNSTYRNSYLRGDEIARIIEIRYGQPEQKSSSYAGNSKGSRPIQDGLPED
jgi:hypothetical protein